MVTRVGYTGGRTQRDLPQSPARRGHRDHLRPVADRLPRPAGVLLPDPRSDHEEPSGQRLGTSYRSAIFYLDDEQKRVALDTIADVDASGPVAGKVVTEVTPAGDFWEAEPEHQDYLERYPNGYTCHFLAAGLEAADAGPPPIAEHWPYAGATTITPAVFRA